MYMNFKKLLITILYSVILLSAASVCKAAVTVTPASGGSCLNVAPGAYTTIGTITISENSKSDFATPQAGTTLILTAPTGFQFNPGIGNVSYTGGANITAAAIAVTAATITVTLSVSNNNRFDDLFITNIQVRATLPSASGQILRTAVGGTATISGDAAAGGVNHGTLAASATGVTYTSIAAGNWSNTATWLGGVIPGCNSNVIINTAVTGNVTASIANLTINTGGNLTTTSAVTVSTSFVINGTGTYTHNNNSDASTTIFAGTESFSTTSNLIMNRWYNGNVPLGTYVSGNFGNVTLAANVVWNQDGQFAPNRIKGTFTLSGNQCTMDDGTGMTTSLTLQDVIVTGNGNLIMASGTDRNLTLVTNNYTDNSSSLYVTAHMFETYGTLNWTCNGDFNISHDFSAIQGTGLPIVTANVNITGNLNITGGLFDFIYQVNGGLNLTVNGNTNIAIPNGSSHWSHLIEANSQSLTYTTTNLYVYGGNSNNYLQGSIGTVNINILNDFICSGTDVFKFTDQFNSTAVSNIAIGRDFNVTSGTVYIGNSSQNMTWNIGRDLTLSGASSTLIGQYYITGTSSTSLSVTRNFNMTNGTFTQTKNGGAATLTVGGIMNMDAGTFKGIDHTGIGNWGTGTFTFNSFDFDGGIFYAHDGRISDGRTVQVNVTNDFDLNFANATDRVVLLYGATNNNPVLDFNVGGNFNVAGSTSAYFHSSSSTGNETVDIGGNMNISGGTVYFEGTDIGIGNAHDITTNITGNLNVSGGVLRLSSLGGIATINLTGNASISGGTTAVKWDTGAATMNITGTYTQTAGTFFLHARNAATTSVSAAIVNGDFSQTGGIINFDANFGNTNPNNTLTILGANYTIGGTGIMTNANHLAANTVFGSILFNRSGTTVYNRSGNSHDLQQVKMTIAAGCILDASSSTYDMMTSSHSSSIAADHTVLTVNGTLTMGLKSIIPRLQTNYYAQININSGGRLRTQHTGGLYSGSASASCIYSMIGGNNRVNYSLDPNSTVEYYGTDNQKISGIPNGIASGTQHKYGRLVINFGGTADAEYVYPDGSNRVYIRTALTLTSGEFNLDNDHVSSNGGGNTIVLENGAAMTRSSGYLRSETEDGTGIVKWNITTLGSFVYPFGYSSTEYIPFTFAPTSGSSGDVSVATYHTAVTNLPFPSGVTHVRDVTGADNSAYTVDRFWSLVPTGTPTADLTFVTTSAEMGTIASPRAQRWVPSYSGWESSEGIQSNPTSVSALTSGITGLGVWWTLAASAHPLPVELIAFNASCAKNHAELKWSTASEENNDYFSVEKSLNNKDFKSIGVVNGAGTSSQIHHYNFTDENELGSQTFYRLKQTDYNSNFKYSDIISLNNCFENSELSINTSTESGSLNIKINSAVDSRVDVNLFNANGKQMFANYTHLENRTGKIQINCKNWADGIYFINVYDNAERVSEKIFIKRH